MVVLKKQQQRSGIGTVTRLSAIEMKNQRRVIQTSYSKPITS